MDLYPIILFGILISGYFLTNLEFLLTFSIALGFVILKDLLDFDKVSEKILFISLAFLLLTIPAKYLSKLLPILGYGLEYFGTLGFSLILLISLLHYVFRKLVEVR